MKQSKIEIADDASEKRLYTLEDGEHIETGTYSKDNEFVVCISTQVGCAVNCVFCATTLVSSEDKRTFIRNLSDEEIVDQVVTTLDGSDLFEQSDGKPILSFMAIGEPGANIDNVINAIQELSTKYPGARATIATVGNNPKLFSKLKEEEFKIPVKIHTSIHASNDETRKSLIIKAKRSIREVLGDMADYQDSTGLATKANYMLIEGVNDSDEQAEELADLLSEFGIILKVSEFNENPGIDLKPSSQKRIDRFIEIVKGKGVEVDEFHSMGTDIKAGCGQLRRDEHEEDDPAIEKSKADAIELIHQGDHERFKLWRETQSGILDLSELDFTGLDLTDFDFSGSDLTGAILVNVKGISPIMFARCILSKVTVDRNSIGTINAAITEERKSLIRAGSEEDY